MGKHSESLSAHINEKLTSSADYSSTNKLYCQFALRLKKRHVSNSMWNGMIDQKVKIGRKLPLFSF